MTSTDDRADRVWDITVWCEICGQPVTELTDQSGLPESAGNEPDWRHDQSAPWGHGAMNGGKLAEWYDTPRDPGRRATRSHTDARGDLHLVCRPCGNRQSFTKATWRAVAATLATNGENRVSIAQFRALAGALTLKDGPSRRARRDPS